MPIIESRRRDPTLFTKLLAAQTTRRILFYHPLHLGRPLCLFAHADSLQAKPGRGKVGCSDAYDTLISTMRFSDSNRASISRLSPFRPALFIALSVLTVAGARAADAPHSAKLDLEHLKLIRPRLQELVDHGAIPGAVALVAHHGEVAYLDAVGFQDIENKRP